MSAPARTVGTDTNVPLRMSWARFVLSLVTSVLRLFLSSIKCTGSSAAERRTLNREGPGSNPIYYLFDGWVFLISTMPQFTQLYKMGTWLFTMVEISEWIVFVQYLQHGWMLPRMSSWCWNKQVRQGVKHKAIWAVRWTGYRSKQEHTFYQLLKCKRLHVAEQYSHLWVQWTVKLWVIFSIILSFFFQQTSFHNSWFW